MIPETSWQKVLDSYHKRSGIGFNKKEDLLKYLDLTLKGDTQEIANVLCLTKGEMITLFFEGMDKVVLPKEPEEIPLEKRFLAITSKKMATMTSKEIAIATDCSPNYIHTLAEKYGRKFVVKRRKQKVIDRKT